MVLENLRIDRRSLAAVATGLMLFGRHYMESNCTAQENASTSSIETKGSDEDSGTAVVRQLTRCGWTEGAARAVAAANSRIFKIYYEESREEFHVVMALLARLGDRPYVLTRIEDLPQLATLLAGSVWVRDDGPELILRTVPRDRRRNEILSLYAFAATPKDAINLALTLGRDRDLILMLHEIGATDAIGWLTTLPQSEEAAQVYREWVRSSLLSAIRSSDPEDLDRIQTLLFLHAETVRERLDNSSEFRTHFLDRYWPYFYRTMQQQDGELAWGIFVNEPRVWNFLHDHQELGEALYRSHGPIAVELTCAHEYRHCQSEVLQALQAGNEAVIQSLMDESLRKQAMFVQLIQRDLPNETLAKSLEILTQKRAESPELLNYWDTLSNNALKEELGPAPNGPTTWLPGYSAYYLLRKTAQGRDVAYMDLAFAALDAAEGITIVKGASIGLKMVQKGLKKEMTKRVNKEMSEAILKEVAQETREEIGARFFPWTIRQAQKASRESLTKVAERLTSVDVTSQVRFAFAKSGVGRETFGNMTKLDARVFMRGDRRVVVDLAQLAEKNHVVGRAMRITALNAGFDLALDTKIGRNVAVEVIEQGVKNADVADKKVEAWLEHLSIWWLANSDRSLLGLSN